jgi:Phenazine biosynthesis-like protein
MSQAHVIDDVLTDMPLRGNQLAVFEDGSALSDDQMQRLAWEMKVSQTVSPLPAEARSPQRDRPQEPVFHDFLSSGRAAHRSELDYLCPEGCSATSAWVSKYSALH